jgi:hypothetical protein
VVQAATKIVLEPIFEAEFLPCSYGFRARRSATGALEGLRKRGARGGNHVLDADIRDYFGSIDHETGGLLKLLRQWLEGGAMEDGQETAWRRAFFEAHGLVRLRGTIRYPEAV